MASDSPHRLAALEAERERLAGLLVADPLWRELRELDAKPAMRVPAVTAAIEARRQELVTRLSGNAAYAAWLKLGEAVALLRDLQVDDAVPAAGVMEAGPVTEAAAAGRSSPARVPDDLTRISGIDADLVEALGRMGVTRFDEIAAWTAADVKRMRRVLGVGRRLSREQWIEQAAILARGGGTAFAPAVTAPGPVPASAVAGGAPTLPSPKLKSSAGTAPAASASVEPQDRSAARLAERGTERGAEPRSLAAATAGVATRGAASALVPVPLPVRAPPSVGTLRPVAEPEPRAKTSAMFARTPLPGQRRSLLAAIEAAEEAAHQRRHLPDGATGERAAARAGEANAERIGGPDIGSRGRSTVVPPAERAPASGRTTASQRPAATFGRTPEPEPQLSRGGLADAPPLPTLQSARTVAPATRPSAGVVDVPAAAPPLRRLMIDETAGIEDASVGWDAPASGSDAGEAAVQIIAKAPEARAGRRATLPSPEAPTRSFGAGTADSQVRLSPHVGVHEEAVVEIVHRGDGAVRRPAPATRAKPASVSKPAASRRSTFGRLFRGRGAEETE